MWLSYTGHWSWSSEYKHVSHKRNLLKTGNLSLICSNESTRALTDRASDKNAVCLHHERVWAIGRWEMFNPNQGGLSRAFFRIRYPGHLKGERTCHWTPTASRRGWILLDTEFLKEWAEDPPSRIKSWLLKVYISRPSQSLINHHLNFILIRFPDFNKYPYHDHGLKESRLRWPFDLDEPFHWFGMWHDRAEELGSRNWKDQNCSM